MQARVDAPAVELDAVGKHYGTLTALDQVDLALPRGQLLALLGPNGAGKSTAIAICLGLIDADHGVARIFGASPRQLPTRRRVGVMLQSASMPDTLKVRELLAQTRSYYPDPRSTRECVELAGIEDLMGRYYGKLSGGQQRRVQFALAICGRPELLFLDEPSVGLDIQSRESAWQTIRTLVSGGCAVVLTTHYLEEAEALADRVVMLAHGRVVANGSIGEIRARIAQRRVRCISTLEPHAIEAWRDVQSVRREGDRLEIVTDAAESVLRRLLHEDGAVAELEVQRAGLAEAFVEITREAA